MPGDVINGANERVSGESGFALITFLLDCTVYLLQLKKKNKIIKTFHLQTAVVYVVFHLSTFRRC